MHQKERARTSTIEKSDCREKLTVWTGLWANVAFIGPLFFDGNVNGANYLQMLNEYVLPYLFQRFGNQIQDCLFQRLWWAQDGAPGHRAEDVTAWLTEFFREMVISLYREVEWPPRSPDLTPCDFFLCGYLKERESTKHHPAV